MGALCFVRLPSRAVPCQLQNPPPHEENATEGIFSQPYSFPCLSYKSMLLPVRGWSAFRSVSAPDEVFDKLPVLCRRRERPSNAYLIKYCQISKLVDMHMPSFLYSRYFIVLAAVKIGMV